MNTHCGNGHEYTPENTGHFSNDKVSFRFCKQCARDPGVTDLESMTYDFS